MKKIVSISIAISTIVAFVIMYIAWKHNPQGAIYLNDKIDYGYWFFLGFTWFILAFVLVFFSQIILKWLLKGKR